MHLGSVAGSPAYSPKLFVASDHELILAQDEIRFPGITVNEEPENTAEGFAADIERLAMPLFSECFTEETRTIRNLLLITGFALLLFALGVVQVEPKTKLPLLGVTITVTAGLRYVLIALSCYFFSSLLARSYIDWQLWRLKHQAPLLALAAIRNKMDVLSGDHSNRVNAAFATSNQLRESLNLIRQRSPAETQIAEELDTAYKEHQRLQSVYATESAALKAKGVSTHDENLALENGVMFELHKMFYRTQDLSAQLDRERAARLDRTSAEEIMLLRKISEADAEHQKQAVDPIADKLNARLHYMLDTINPAYATFRIRFFFEMTFPILFGLFAITFSIVAP